MFSARNCRKMQTLTFQVGQRGCGLGLQHLVEAFFVPVYQCTSRFVWAKSVIPEVLAYQKIPGTVHRECTRNGLGKLIFTHAAKSFFLQNSTSYYSAIPHRDLKCPPTAMARDRRMRRDEYRHVCNFIFTDPTDFQAFSHDHSVITTGFVSILATFAMWPPFADQSRTVTCIPK
jgi:hypothetical protein